MMTPDVNVILLDFDTKEREMVVINEDGSYTIFINSRHSSSVQLQAYKHAMKHINNCDFQKDNVQKIEAFAHAKSTVTEEQSNLFEERRKRITKRKRKFQREMKKCEERVAFILEEFGEQYLFDQLEHLKLYGDDL